MKACILLVLAAPIAAGQSISAGVKSGVPLTDLIEARGVVGGVPLSIGTRRFTVGPALEIRLPLGFGIELDALYKRFNETGGSIQGGIVSATGSSWEFPLLGKFRFGPPIVKPYFEAGPSFNYLSGHLVTFRTLPAPPEAQPKVSAARAGVAVGAGIEFKVPVVRIVPGIRMTHWGGRDRWSIPSSSSVDILVGIMF